jgi:hypothetical protein
MAKIQLNFLGADVPLTKTFHPDGRKDAYPMVKNFTSYSEQVENLTEFHDVLVKHSKAGHCLLKGKLTRNLNHESRAGSTRTDDTTQWLCLDFDRHETPDLDDTLVSLGLGNISYIIQYSASHGRPDCMGTVSAHIFMLLNQELPAPAIKAWLMAMNLDKEVLSKQLIPSRSKCQIAWTLDITTCQNDKLIYIAPPKFIKPLKDPLQTRIKLVKRKKDALDVSSIGEPSILREKERARAKLNELRELEGLPKRTARTKWVGDKEIESKPDICVVTGVKDCGEWVRLNINGGDSWAYCYAKNNPELIHDFKSDAWYLTKEFVPGHYAEIKMEQRETTATPSEDGDLILAFCDLKTANYYRGLWNPETQKLQLHRAKDRTQLNDWWMSFGRVPPEFIETWEITYDPKGDWIVDTENHRINTFKPSQYMLLEPNPEITPTKFPSIYNMVRHFLGEAEGTRLSDHFFNWLAVIFQRKAKPITAWVNHGVQGTGKGFFMAKVIRPLFGSDNVAEVGIDNIEDKFNEWQYGKLFINVNEIDVDDFSAKGRVEAKFKMLITDSVMPVRRMQQTMTQETNYGSYLFSSNKKKPVIIPTDDRRYNVGNRQGIKLVPPTEEAVANELEAFTQWLLAHQADVKLANTIIHTEARETMQRLSQNSIEDTCQAILTGDFDNFWMNMVDDDYLARGTGFNELERIYNSLIKDIGQQILDRGVRQTLTRDDMGIILKRCVGNVPLEPNKLTSLLRNNGIDTKQVRHKNRKTYGIHVVWQISPEIRKEMEEVLIGKPRLRRAK